MFCEKFDTILNVKRNKICKIIKFVNLNEKQSMNSKSIGFIVINGNM